MYWCISSKIYIPHTWPALLPMWPAQRPVPDNQPVSRTFTHLHTLQRPAFIALAASLCQNVTDTRPGGVVLAAVTDGPG